MLGILGGEGKQENKNEVQEMENYGAEAGSAVKLLEELLNLGYRKNASDIHLEPQEDRMVVRMRLDGMLLHVREYDKEMHQPLVTRAKVLSGMDIDPQKSGRDPVSYRTDRMREDYHIIYDPGISRETAGEYRDHRGSCGAISSGDQPDAGE